MSSTTCSRTAGSTPTSARTTWTASICKSEAQIALDLAALGAGETPEIYNPPATRRRMPDTHGLAEFLTDAHMPAIPQKVDSDMQVVEL